MRLDHITSSCLGMKMQTRQTNSLRYPPYARRRCNQRPSNRLPGEHSYVEPPDPISNSEVKRVHVDGSVHPHARVDHRQGLYPRKGRSIDRPFSFYCLIAFYPSLQLGITEHNCMIGVQPEAPASLLSSSSKPATFYLVGASIREG